MSKEQTIAIIGVGLIGGSLGLALKKSKGKSRKLKIIGIGRHKEKLKLAKTLGAIDEYTTDLASGVKTADIVVIATPVDTIVPITRKILPFVRHDCIITDVGSVKAPIVRNIEKLLQYALRTTHYSPTFIGAHPLAGSEKVGVRFAKSDMFENATVVITPVKNKSEKYNQAMKKIYELWKSVGAKVIYVSPDRHDCLISITSHLPHVLSACLVEIVNRKSKVDTAISKFLAGSFKDITRISDSDANSWTAICQHNKRELTKAISDYIRILNRFKYLLNSSSTKKLLRFFSQCKNNRYKLLKLNLKVSNN